MKDLNTEFAVRKSIVQPVDLPILRAHGVTLAILREDLLHPTISGNKFRKLKYNLLAARDAGQRTLLTFGGAYSNHIAAVAAAGAAFGFSTIGIIRGDELIDQPRNPTLSQAEADGMQLHFVSRSDYRRKAQDDFLADLRRRFGEFYLLPEGGTNGLAVQGCEEILSDETHDFDVIACAVGTGGTLAGLINTAAAHQRILGFPAVRDPALEGAIQQLTLQEADRKNWQLISDYHFGGYGQVTPSLLSFIDGFSRDTGVPLEPIYGGKMLYGLMDMIIGGCFAAGTRILAIHTGGLQGWSQVAVNDKQD